VAGYFDIDAVPRNIGRMQANAMSNLYDMGGQIRLTQDPMMNGMGPWAQHLANNSNLYDMGGQMSVTEDATADAAMRDLKSLEQQTASNTAVYEYGKRLAIAKNMQAAADKQAAARQAQATPGEGFDPSHMDPTKSPSSSTGGGAMSSGMFPHEEMVRGFIPDDLKNDPELMKIIAAGSKAESGWDVNRVQNGFNLGSGAGARGLFQFDMGGMGAPWKGNEQALLGTEGAKLQASKIVPLYAQAYREGVAKGLRGQDLASFTAGAAERPRGWTPGAVNWGDTAQNYRQAYNELGQTPTRPAPEGSGAPYQINRQSQFKLGLNKTEAEAFCGPAAALALAQYYGNNIPVEQVRTFAQQSGWSTAGMQGPASEVNLLHKLGVKAQSEAWNEARAQQLLQGGKPLIIDTPGHYFVADQYDPSRGYRVGTSGTDLREGAEWMTPAQMARLAIAGSPRTMIYA
jgi:hypothetical protein